MISSVRPSKFAIFISIFSKKKHFCRFEDLKEQFKLPDLRERAAANKETVFRTSLNTLHKSGQSKLQDVTEAGVKVLLEQHRRNFKKFPCRTLLILNLCIQAPLSYQPSLLKKTSPWSIYTCRSTNQSSILHCSCRATSTTCHRFIST